MPRFSRIFFLLFALSFSFLWAEDLQVHLPTKKSSPPLYIGPIETDDSEYDWRYLDELRAILEFDFSASGKCFCLEQKKEWSEFLPSNQHRKHLNLTFWKKQKIPFVLTLEVLDHHFFVTAVQTHKALSKRYPPIALSHDFRTDRVRIHQLADAIHKDLFGQKGVASLKLIYTVRQPSSLADWQSEVWICDADGGNAKQVTHTGLYCLSPFFLPTSPIEFAFTAYKEGQSKIYKASLRDPSPVPLISLRGNQMLASISADARHMAFVSDVAGRPDLFLQTFDEQGREQGKARQLFSAPRATQASSCFSPNGDTIAFVSDKDGPPRIYTLSLLSLRRMQKALPYLITRKNRENTSPSWSPDGKKLAYSAKVDGVRQIWIYDIETQEEFPLTSGPLHKENPSWAPNSFHLVYNTESEEVCELYLINLFDKKPILLKAGEGQKRFASWSLFP